MIVLRHNPYWELYPISHAEPEEPAVSEADAYDVLERLEKQMAEVVEELDAEAMATCC